MYYSNDDVMELPCFLSEGTARDERDWDSDPTSTTDSSGEFRQDLSLLEAPITYQRYLVGPKVCAITSTFQTLTSTFVSWGLG
jgi:hypothetical protein